MWRVTFSPGTNQGERFILEKAEISAAYLAKQRKQEYSVIWKLCLCYAIKNMQIPYTLIISITGCQPQIAEVTRRDPYI